jgi:hypothetical protein
MATSFGPLDAGTLLDKIGRDPHLGADLKRSISRLAATTPDPAILIPRLQRVAQELWTTFPRWSPRHDLIRVMPARTFLAHHSRPEVRAAFTTVGDFVTYVGSSDQQSELLMSFLSEDHLLIPMERSWLAEAELLVNLTGQQLSQTLEIDKDPPLIVFFFPLDRLIDAGITVRNPCSLDSAVAPNFQWRDDGLASGIREYVDGDIPRSCVLRIDWRP